LSVAGQPSFDEFQSARHRQGPFAIRPQLAIVDVGVDTNVFNTVTDPRSDFTSTLRPAADLWLRTGRWEAAGRTQVGANFFRRYTSERSVDTDNRVRLAGRPARFTPFGTATFLSTRDRISPEIDDRVRRLDRSAAAGIDVKFGSRTTARTSVGRSSTRYNDNVAAASYAEALNRTETVVTAAMRYRLTSLTTLVFQGDKQANHFVHEETRNADTLSVIPGVEFDRGALVSGRGFVGYRRFNFRDPRLRDYGGLAATVDLTYTLQDVTRFGLTADRNVEYSFELEQPYYVSSGLALTITNQASDRWSLFGLVSLRRLDYRQSLPSSRVDPRVDEVAQTRGGIGYRVGPRIRAELTTNYQRRSSPRADRRYDGLRLGSAIFFEF
jgi:hypothetical protein